MPANLDALRLGLAEAAAWCKHVVGRDADASLWTEDLLDISRQDEHALWHRLNDAPEKTVATVLRRRAELITQRPVAPPRSSEGRVLVCEWDCSLFDGASRAESHGLVDLWDIPAWDTWIGLVPAGLLRRPGIDRSPALLAWIPDTLVPRAQIAIDVNPVEVLTWLDLRNRSLAEALVPTRNVLSFIGRVLRVRQTARFRSPRNTPLPRPD